MADKIVTLKDKNDNNLYPVAGALFDNAIGTDALHDGAVTKEKVNAASLIDLFYPVGSYYETSDTSFNPNTAWGGTWVEDTSGRVIVALDTGTFNSVGKIGGAETHTLTVGQMPSHRHVSLYDYSGALIGTGQGTGGGYYIPNGKYGYGSIATAYEGGGEAHNNIQPYVVAKRWHRTA